MRRCWSPLVGAWLFAVGGPLAYYAARSARILPWLWPLPPGASGRASQAALLVVPGLLIANSLDRWSERAGRSRWLVHRAITTALVIGLAFATYLFRNAYGPTGDGLDTWVPLAGSPFIMGSEPLGHWTHYLFFTLFTQPHLRLALELASVAAGMVCLVGMRILLPTCFPRVSAVVLLLALVGVPIWIVYLGYIETTPFAYAFTTLYLLSAVRYLRLREERPPWIEGLLLGLGVWTHGAVCFAAGGHAVLVAHWFSCRSDGPALARRVAVAFGVASMVFVPLGATLLWAYHFGSGLSLSPWFGNAMGGSDGRRFVSGSEILVASFWHDRLNLVMLACPVLQLLFLAAIGPSRLRLSWTTGTLLAALLGTLGMGMFYGADLGVYQDFDLLSFFAIPANILVLSWLVERLPALQLRLTTMAIFASNVCFGIAPFLALRQ